MTRKPKAKRVCDCARNGNGDYTCPESWPKTHCPAHCLKCRPRREVKK
jgi:hypothetical protein